MPLRARLAAAVAIAVVLPSAASIADEGMWLFNHFPADKVEKAYGFKPDQAWLDHVRLSTLRIPGHCSASFVSPHGLVLTNHHCVSNCIESLSNPKQDLAASGFYAKQAGDELKCVGLELDQPLAITDVTERINRVTAGKDGAEFNAAYLAERAVINGECIGGEANIRCEVIDLHGGGLYSLYRNRVYDDVRLVFVPEHAIADFGGDIDDFHFPHTSLDIAYLRIYADGKPLDTTANHLHQAAADIEPGDVTFAAGSPGFTFRGDTLARLEFRRDVELPRDIFYDRELRGLLTEFSAIGVDQGRIAARPLAALESKLKYNQGRFAALTGPNIIKLRWQAESDLRQKIADDAKLNAQYGEAWDKIGEVLDDFRNSRDRYQLTVGGHGFQSELFDLARKLVRKAQTADTPAPTLQAAAVQREQPKTQKTPNLRAMMKSSAASATYDAALEKLNLAFSLTQLREALGPDDALVRKVLGRKSPQQRAAELIDGTKLNNPEFADALAKGGPEAIDKSADPMIVFAREIDGDLNAIETAYAHEVEQPMAHYSRQAARAAFEAYGHAVYPDASYTPRISYGSVAGYRAAGQKIAPIVRLGALFDRATDAEPYQLPANWLAAKASLDMRLSLNFVTTNDVIGGNSGSPVVTKSGDIAGVLFDINYPALGGYFAYDVSANRAIGVSIGAIREALSKVYHADRLVAELAE
jgi:hypothetical protein